MVDVPKIPTVSNFLYFFNLITGNIVIGWVHFGLSFVIVIAYLMFLVFDKEAVHVEVESETIDADIKPDGFTGTVLLGKRGL
jgi:hypothetical protein